MKKDSLFSRLLGNPIVLFLVFLLCWLPALGFLAAIWLTCLLGPVALMRYLLSLYYAIPVLGAAMLTKS